MQPAHSSDAECPLRGHPAQPVMQRGEGQHRIQPGPKKCPFKIARFPCKRDVPQPFRTQHKTEEFTCI